MGAAITTSLLTYTTLDQEVIDLTTLTQHERDFFEKSYRLYKERGSWRELTGLVRGPENPVLGGTRRISREVRETPLYRAVRDLEDRLGIISGAIAPADGDEPGTDPLTDQLLTVAEAAIAKGTTTMAVRKAIVRGDVVATSERPRRVSGNSLALWTVSGLRQSAGLRRRSVSG